MLDVLVFFTAFPSSAFRVVLILFPSSFASPSDIIHRLWGNRASMGRWLCKSKNETNIPATIILQLATKQNRVTDKRSKFFFFFLPRTTFCFYAYPACLLLLSDSVSMWTFFQEFRGEWRNVEMSQNGWKWMNISVKGLTLNSRISLAFYIKYKVIHTTRRYLNFLVFPGYHSILFCPRWHDKRVSPSCRGLNLDLIAFLYIW